MRVVAKSISNSSAAACAVTIEARLSL